MENTNKLVVALLKDDFKTAKESLQNAVSSIINDRIDVKKEEIRDKISEYSDE